MNGLVISGLIAGAIGVALTHPNAVANFYAEIYPADPLKREALERCIDDDHNFNRLAADERAGCYARVLSIAQAAGYAAADQRVAMQNANFVDLWRAAGRGHVPKNDIVLQQDTVHLIRPAAAHTMP